MMNRDFALEIKAVEDSGQFEGLAATYGGVDLGGDRILPGAFTESLKRGAERPVLWAHDQAAPIALGVLSDSAEGLRIKATLDLDTQAGREAHSRLRKRIVRGLSIGFNVLDRFYDAGVRVLKAIDVLEVSLVAVPMDPRAQVTSVKSGITTIRDYERFLHEAGWSKSEATRLASHGWRGLAAEPDGEAELLAWLRANSGRAA
jgi:HK97 family phage prohead protease